MQLGQSQDIENPSLNVPRHAPNQFRRTSDVNASIELDVLYSTCQSFCRTLDANFSMDIGSRKEFILPFEHHQSSIKLNASSGHRFHLCTLLLKSLDLACMEDMQGKESKPSPKSRERLDIRFSYNIWFTSSRRDAESGSRFGSQCMQVVPLYDGCVGIQTRKLVLVRYGTYHFHHATPVILNVYARES